MICVQSVTIGFLLDLREVCAVVLLLDLTGQEYEARYLCGREVNDMRVMSVSGSVVIKACAEELG